MYVPCVPGVRTINNYVVDFLCMPYLVFISRQLETDGVLKSILYYIACMENNYSELQCTWFES